MNLQRALVNQMILEQGDFDPPTSGRRPRPALPPLLTTRDVLRYATINGAKALRLDSKTGSLTPGKEADIIILDADRDQRGAAQPGAGRGRLADGPHQRRDGDRRGQGAQVEGAAARRQPAQLRRQLEDSRDYLFSAAGIPQNLFPPYKAPG